MTDRTPLLNVCDLRTVFDTDSGPVCAVDGVSFAVPAGRTFALVGESGCGKTATALSVLALVPPPGQVTAGRVELAGEDLLALGERRMRAVRGGRIGMVFQEPAAALDPVFTCGRQIVEAIRLHRRVGARRAKATAIDMLARAGVDDPARRAKQYPHQLSGGLRQRVMIAIALAAGPELLIADEPTTALDVTTQWRILRLLRDLRDRDGLGVLLITHDLAVVAESADGVGVMYAGQLVETADVRTLFAEPAHPYTRGLLSCASRLGEGRGRFDAIAGTPPDLSAPPSGCRFHPRCPVGRDDQRCSSARPPLCMIGPGHWCACWQCTPRGSSRGEPDDVMTSPDAAGRVADPPGRKPRRASQSPPAAQADDAHGQERTDGA